MKMALGQAADAATCHTLCWRGMNKGKGGRAKAPKRGEGAERVISDKQYKTDDYSGLHI